MTQHYIPLTHSHIKHLSISGFAHVETGEKTYSHSVCKSMFPIQKQVITMHCGKSKLWYLGCFFFYLCIFDYSFYCLPLLWEILYCCCKMTAVNKKSMIHRVSVYVVTCINCSLQVRNESWFNKNWKIKLAVGNVCCCLSELSNCINNLLSIWHKVSANF